MKKTVLFIVCLLAAAGLFAVDINEALDTAADNGCHCRHCQRYGGDERVPP